MNLSKKHLIFVLKLLMAAAIIGWLIKQQRLDLSKLSHIQADARTVVFLGLSGVSVFLGLVLMSWRFMLILHRRCLTVCFWDCFRLTLIGSFTGAVLPGLVGGDVVKAAYLCGLTRQDRADAVAAVLADRLVGTYALVLLAALAMPVAFAMHALFLTTRLVVVILLLLAVMTLGVWLVSLERWGKVALLRSIYDRGRMPLQNLVSALRFYAQSPRLIASSIALSLANHFLFVVSFALVAILLRDPLPIVAHFVINPLAISTNALPVTPGGIGVAESAFSLLFERAGSPNGVLIGLIGRLVAYAVFAIGGSIALIGSNCRQNDKQTGIPKAEVLAGRQQEYEL